MLSIFSGLFEREPPARTWPRNYVNVTDRMFPPGTVIFTLPGWKGWVAREPSGAMFFVDPDSLSTTPLQKVDEALPIDRGEVTG